MSSESIGDWERGDAHLCGHERTQRFDRCQAAIEVDARECFTDIERFPVPIEMAMIVGNECSLSEHLARYYDNAGKSSGGMQRRQCFRRMPSAWRRLGEAPLGVRARGRRVSSGPAADAGDARAGAFVPGEGAKKGSRCPGCGRSVAFKRALPKTLITVTAPRRYLWSHRGRMGDRDRLRRGLPIGSGQVKEMCKNTLNRRLRLNNARRQVDNVDPMAALLCLHHSRQWDAFWTQQHANAE